jgi:S1-C subfamily serine protease
MNRPIAFCLLFLGFAICPVTAQTPSVKVKIRAAVYDRDLNLKPVPHLKLTFRSLDKDNDKDRADPTVLQTTLDGTAEAELPPGSYQVSTSKPIEFQGKTYLWDLRVQLSPPAHVLELSNDNAEVTDLTGGRGAQVDSLAEHFRELKSSAVTVWQQDGHGTGFLVDPSGLIVTNQHVVAGFTYLAVQLDEKRKLAAEVLAEDKQKDVAVLRVNLANVPDVAVAPIAQGPGTLLEGERVFTIGNPLDKEKVLTTGVASKVDRESIISDISISAGNSGGALFNSSGTVVGITTYRKGRGAGAGLTGIVPIAEAADTLAAARTKAAGTPPPSPRLLPVPPPIKYPLDALRAVGNKPWAKDTYYFKLGDFDVEVVTPVTRYEMAMERASRAEKERQKRAKKSGAPPEDEHQPTDYETQYDSVVLLNVSPRLKTDFWKSMAAGQGQVVMRFKSDFLKMRLLCGSNEIEPILPSRFPVTVIGQGGRVYVDDASYEGIYTYQPDAISPTCKEVSVEVYLSKEPDKPLVKVLDPNAVTQIWNDFDPFRKALESNAKTPPK